MMENVAASLQKTLAWLVQRVMLPDHFRNEF